VRELYSYSNVHPLRLTVDTRDGRMRSRQFYVEPVRRNGGDWGRKMTKNLCLMQSHATHLSWTPDEK